MGQGKLVGIVGFEPTASRVQGEHSNQTELYPDTNFHRARVAMLAVAVICLIRYPKAHWLWE